MRVPLPKRPKSAAGTRTKHNHRLTQKEVLIANELDAVSARVEEILRNTFDPKLLPLLMRGARATGRLIHRPLTLWIAWKIAASDNNSPVVDLVPKSEEASASEHPQRGRSPSIEMLRSDALPKSDLLSTNGAPPVSENPAIRHQLPSDAPPAAYQLRTRDKLSTSGLPSISDEPSLGDEIPPDEHLIGDEPFARDDPLVCGSPPTSDEPPIREGVFCDAQITIAEPVTRDETPISNVAITGDQSFENDDLITSRSPPKSDEPPIRDGGLSDARITSAEPITRDEAPISNVAFTNDQSFKKNDLLTSKSPHVSDEPPVKNSVFGDAQVTSVEPFIKDKRPISNAVFVSAQSFTKDALPTRESPPASAEPPITNWAPTHGALISADPFTKDEPSSGGMGFTSNEPFINDDLPISSATSKSDEPFTIDELPISNPTFIKEFKLMEWQKRPQEIASSVQQQDASPQRKNRRRKSSHFSLSWVVIAISSFAFVWYLISSPWPLITTLQHLAAFPNCAATEMLGLAPAYRGQPGYWSHNDADGDGVACKAYPPNQ